MPELPEVETIRRQLAPAVEGRVLEELEVLDARWCEPAAPAEVADAVRGRRVERLSRRGKYLVWELEDEVHLVESFAEMAALAIENARLKAETEKSNHELREALDEQAATNHILAIISQSPTDVQPVLDAVARAALRFCGAKDALIALRDGEQNAITRASKTIRDMKWFEVVQTRGHIENGSVGHYQVTLRVGFTLEG